MANAITRHIPNTITSCNLFCGCIASYMAFQGSYGLAFLFIVMGAVFDFFDGMSARLFHEVTYPEFLMPVAEYMPYTAFLISVFSALRLGKFNIDPRQSTSFIGLPTPANTLFWASLIVGAHDFLVSDSFNALWLLVMVIVMSLLLIAEIPMFSLKFKNLSWEHNKTSYIFLIVSIPLLIFLRTGGFAAVIVWYILLSLITGRKKKQ